MPKQNNINDKPVRIWDVIYWDDAKKISARDPELHTLKLYTLLPGNAVKVNPGLMKKDDIVFYDTTYASDDFKIRNASIIEELEIVEVKKKISDKKDGFGRLLTLIPKESLSSLSKEERKQLGHAFCTFIDGKVKPVVYHSGHTSELDELFVSIDTSSISPELLEKILPDTHEVMYSEDGTYENIDSLSNGKTM